MAKLTDSEVKHVADLAQITVTDDEISIYKDQLSEVVEYIDQLSEVDTSGVTPTSQTTGIQNVFREDIIDVTRMLTLDEALSNAPRKHNNYFVVDKILKNKND